MVHLIEFWDYLVQFLACAAGCIGAVRQFLKSRRPPYVLLACFFWTYALGTLYWTLHLLLLDATPQVFYVSELGWIASYIFLLTMEMTLPSAQELRFRTKLSCRSAAVHLIYHVRRCLFQCADVYGHHGGGMAFDSWACFCAALRR